MTLPPAPAHDDVRSSSRAIWPLILGVILLAGYFSVASKMDYFVDPELDYHAEYNHQPVGEMSRPHDRDLARFYLLGKLWKLTLLLPATLCLTWAAVAGAKGANSERWLPSLRSLMSRRGIAVATVATALALLFLRFGVLNSRIIYDDEASYLFQAQVLGLGQLYQDASPELSAVFRHPCVFIREGRWMGNITSGHPFLLMLGLKVGWAWLLPFLLALCMPVLLYLVGREIYPDRTAALGAMLIGVSPLFLFTASTVMNHISTLFFLLVFLLAYLRSRPGRSMVWPCLAGLALGIAFYIRPQDGAGFGLPFAVWSVYQLARYRNRAVWSRQWLMLLAFCLPLAWFLVSNEIATGDWLTPAYRFRQTEMLFGFGTTPRGNDYTPAFAIVHFMRNLQRNNLWLFGWPFSMIFLFSRILRGAIRREEKPLLGIIAGVAGVYIMFPEAGVMELGGRYHFSMLPALLLLSAAEMLDLHHWFSRHFSGQGRALVPIFVGLSIVLAALTFGVEKCLHFMNLSARVMQVEAVAEANVEKPAVVEIYSKIPAGWVFGNPVPDPELRDPILYLSTAPAADILQLLDWLEERDGQRRNYYRFRWMPLERKSMIQKLSHEELEQMAEMEAQKEMERDTGTFPEGNE